MTQLLQPVDTADAIRQFTEIWQMVHRASAGGKPPTDASIELAWRTLSDRYPPAQIVLALKAHLLAVKWAPTVADIAGRIDYPAGRDEASARGWSALRCGVERAQHSAVYHMRCQCLAATCGSLGLPFLITEILRAGNNPWSGVSIRNEFRRVFLGHSETIQAEPADDLMDGRRVFEVTDRAPSRQVTIDSDNQRLAVVEVKWKSQGSNAAAGGWCLVAVISTGGGGWRSVPPGELPAHCIPAGLGGLLNAPAARLPVIPMSKEKW